MSVENRIEALNPRAQPIFVSIRRTCNDLVFPLRFPGFTLKYVETLRDLAGQLAAFESGASQVKEGYHNYGLACDAGVFDSLGVYIKDGSHPAYEAYGLVAEAHGCVWGGRWKKKDAAHSEYHPGFTLEQFKAALSAGHDLWTT